MTLEELVNYIQIEEAKCLNANASSSNPFSFKAIIIESSVKDYMSKCKGFQNNSQNNHISTNFKELERLRRNYKGILLRLQNQGHQPYSKASSRVDVQPQLKYYLIISCGHNVGLYHYQPLEKSMTTLDGSHSRHFSTLGSPFPPPLGRHRTTTSLWIAFISYSSQHRVAIFQVTLSHHAPVSQ